MVNVGMLAKIRRMHFPRRDVVAGDSQTHLIVSAHHSLGAAGSITKLDPIANRCGSNCATSSIPLTFPGTSDRLAERLHYEKQSGDKLDSQRISEQIP